MSEKVSNYNDLLDLWAEEVFKQADKSKEISDNAEIGSYKHGYHKGFYDGMYMAVSILTRYEKVKFKKD